MFVRVCSFHSQAEAPDAGDPQGGHAEALHNAYGFCPVLTAPAPSQVEIWVPEPTPVRGLLGGSADYCDGATFEADGEFIGRVRTPYEVTSEKILSPGLHRLEARAEGRETGCLTLWGFGEPPWLKQPPPHYLTIGAVARHTGPALEKWIRYHLETGVSHFYLLDACAGRAARTIHDCGLGNQVTVADFPEEEVDPAGLHFIRRWGPQCFWMGLTGTDEFLIPKLSGNLSRMLSAFAEYGGLRIPAAASGPPDDRTSASPWLAKPWRDIVQPRFVAGADGSGCFQMRPFRPIVGEHFDENLSTRHIETAPAPSRPVQGSPTISPASRSGGITGFIHVAAVNHWEAVLSLQLSKIRSSGLLDRSAAVLIGISGAGEDIATKSEVLRHLPEKITIVRQEPALSRYEFPTLECLQAHCRSANGHVWYLHTKGVVNAYPIQRAWRNRMEEFVVIHHDLASRKLHQGYVAAAGYGSPDMRWPIPGNFWWATNRHIRSLPDLKSLDQTNRHEAERWIAMKGIRNFYFHDHGDTLFDGWEITSARSGAEPVTTSGYHGWDFLPVLPSGNTACDQTVSAHAPSVITLDTRFALKVFGFTCRTAGATGWQVEFLLNDQPAGKSETPGWLGRTFPLPPGQHTLEIKLHGSSAEGAHTGWGISKETH